MDSPRIPINCGDLTHEIINKVRTGEIPVDYEWDPQFA